jgi:hypothetical protein
MARFPLKDMIRWAKNVADRQDGILRQSVQDVVHEANTPQAQGGKMPVDTGFLRGSLAASTSGLPVANGIPVELAILDWKPAESSLWIGWTAKYARHMEARYGFMRSAAQNWPAIVKRNVIKAALR